MAILKTYSIQNDITGQAVKESLLHEEIDTASVITGFEGLNVTGDVLDILGTTLDNETLFDSTVLYHIVPPVASFSLFAGKPVKHTIASGVIATTSSFLRIDTEASAATDDLDTINNTRKGVILVIKAFSNVRTVVLKDGTGNLKLAGDCTLDNSDDSITLIHDNNNNLVELSRSNNGA